MAMPLANSYRIQRALEYGRHDGKALAGDLYLPKAAGPYPVLVAVHGGDWRFADSTLYQYWGPYLAQHGYALFAINYRLDGDGKSRFPAQVADVRGAIQYLRSKGSGVEIDPDRIGLIGDSAGAHLAAMAALAGDTAPFNHLYADDGLADVSASVKVFIGIYGVYDLAAQWAYDQRFHADDNISEVFLGAKPAEAPQQYADASPLTYATHPPTNTSYFLSWGTADDRVDYRQQSALLATTLKAAGADVTTHVFKRAPHYWMSDPLRPGAYPARLAPVLLRFLHSHL